MTGWIIFGSIVLVIILILIQSVCVTVVYEKDIEIKVKLLFFTLYERPARKKKRVKVKKQKKPKKARVRSKDKSPSPTTDKPSEDTAAVPDQSAGDSVRTEQSAEKNSDTSGKQTGTAKSAPKAKPAKKGYDLEMIMDYIKSASPPVKRLLKHIRIRNVYIDWVVATDDAAKTALEYGGICAAVYSFIKAIEEYFSCDVKEINIEADFSKEHHDIFAYFTMKLRISTILSCSIWLLFRMAGTYLKYNKKTGTKK